MTLAVGLFAAGCSGAPAVPDRPAVQRAEVSRLEVKDQSFTEFTAVSHVEIRSAQQVRAVEARYELLVNGEVHRTGTVPLGQELPAGGGTVEVAVTAPYADGDGLAEVLADDTPLSIVIRGSVRTSDDVAWEFSRAGRVRAPRVPEVKVWHVEAGAFPQEGEVGLVFILRVENRNPFEIQLEHLTYDLAIGGKKLIEQGTAGRRARVPASSMAQLEIPLTLSEQNFPNVRNAIRTGRGLDYALDGVVRLGVGRVPVALTGPIELGKGAPSN